MIGHNEYAPAAPLTDEGEIETRSLPYGYGWGGGGVVPGAMPLPSMTNGHEYGNPATMYTPPHYGGFGGIGYPASDGLYPVIGFNPEILHSVTQSFITECPVCMEVLMRPIYQCSNGHIICNSCIDRLDFCRQCSVPLAGPKIRNIAVEQICESIQIKCPYHGEGCQIMARGDELRTHLEICEFRAIPICSQLLGFHLCEEKVTALTSLVHLREAHEADVVENANFKLRIITSSTTFEDLAGNSEGLVWGPVIVTQALDTDIVLMCTTSPHVDLCFTGYLLGCSEEDNKNYRMKIQIDSNKSRLEWTGNLLSAHHNNRTDHVSNVNTYQVPLQTLKQFAKPDANEEIPDQVKLKVKVAFWKLCDENKPYQTCFVDSDTGENTFLEKLVLQSKPRVFGEEALASYASTIVVPPTAPEATNHSHTVSYSSTESYYPFHFCTNCKRPLAGVIYQCLQCGDATYFCKHCAEIGHAHSYHLMLRVANTMQQPLAALAYESVSGKLN